MTPEQLSVICDSLDKACSMAPDFGERFYRRLSSDYPETKIIFNAISMEAQHTRFISMLGIILARMKEDRPVTLLLHDLGKQHDMRGVKDEHFEDFGVTLMTVLDDLLGNEFDRYMHDAWVAVYGEITKIMKSAMGKTHKSLVG